MDEYWSEEEFWEIHQRRAALRKKLIIITVVSLLIGGVFLAAAWRDRDVFVPNLPEAELAIAAGDYDTAMLHLKALLQERPQDGALRYQLGRTHLLRRKTATALKEFEAARHLGYQNETYAQDFVETLILNKELKRAARQLAKFSHPDNSRWSFLHAMLDFAAGRIDEAKRGFEVAISQDKNNIEAQRGLAQAELTLGNIAAARAAIDKLPEQYANGIQAGQLKGTIELAAKNYAAAQAAFRHVLEQEPKAYGAHLGLLRAFIGAEDWQQAANHAAHELPLSAEQDPVALYLRGVIANGQRQPKIALIFLYNALQLAPSHLPSLRLAAELHFRAGNFSKAKELAQRIREDAPTDPGVQRILGAADLATGHVSSGLSTLEIKQTDLASHDDASLLAMLGAAYAKNGEFDLSDKVLARAQELEPNSTNLRMQAALTKITAGDKRAASTELEALVAERPDYALAQAMLVMVALVDGKLDLAARRAEELVAKFPQTSTAHNVQGLVFETQQQFELAHAAFVQALQKDDKFHPARINLARLAIKQNDASSAQAYFRAILKHDPYELQALLGLARLALHENEINEALEHANTALSHNPDRYEPLLLLCRLYILRGKFAQALQTAEKAYAIAPSEPNTQTTLVRTAILNRRPDSAGEALAALKNRYPDAIEITKLELELMALSGYSDALMERAEQLLARAPEDVGANHAVARLALANGNTPRAHAIASRFVGNANTVILGHELHGDAYALEHDWKKAEAAYQAALDEEPSSNLLLKLVRLDQLRGNPTETRLTTWLKSHPSDTTVRRVYAATLQEEGETLQAINQYEMILDLAPTDAITLNNLAWLYTKTNDSRAIRTAQRGYDAAPTQPAVADTYGWILFKAGQFERALNLLTKASEGAPQNPDIAFHLAAAYAQSGQRKYAQRLLTNILAAQDNFASRAEAEDLLAKLER